MALSDKILDRVSPENLRKGSTLAAIAKRRGVARTADFRRIESLPRRVWDADKGELDELRFGLSEMLRPSQLDMPPDELYILNVIQAAALRAIHDHRGAFLPISVGGGKAFIALLAAVVLDAERPVLFVPADLREQTNRKVIPDLMRHFRLHPRLRIIGNSELSLEKNNAMLNELQPDLIILDECFTGDTLVRTPAGFDRIDSLRKGMHVASFDDTTGKTSFQRIKATWSRPTSYIIELTIAGHKIKTTLNHPFLTPGGWVRADQLKEGSAVVSLVREASREGADEQVLFDEMLSLMAVESTSTNAQRGYQEEDEQIGQNAPREGPVDSEGHIEADAHEKPNAQRENTGEGVGDTPTDQTPAPRARRERTARTEGAAHIGRRVGLADGVCCGDRETQERQADPLQDRYRQPVGQSGRGSRRGISWDARATSSGSPQRSFPQEYGLACVESVQQRRVNPNGPDGKVYNLEVDGTHTYVVSHAEIVVHNCHEYKNKKAGRTRRMSRYMAEHPETIMVATSGTVSSRSLKDYQHIIRWCLGDAATPMPIKWVELCDWADALDEGVPDQSRMAPGALDRFCSTGENARQGYRRRLTETPGVVASGAEELGVSLRIRKLQPNLPADVSRMIGDLRASWEDPNGDSIAEAVHIWRLARQLALGFWYEWIPPAPRAWLDARKAWKGHVRHTLNHNKRNLDTELQVWNEQAREHGEPRTPLAPTEPDEGALPEAWSAYKKADEQYSARLAEYEQQHAAWVSAINPIHCEWCGWYEIKDTFKPNPVAQWIDFFMVDEVARWLKGGDGIVWVEHPAFGERLAQDLKIPYFGAGKKASREILDASGPIIASVRAHGQGKNLQQWHRNLVTSPSSSGKTWEQKTGRTHRQGQKADEVIFDVFMSIEEQINSFTQACADAVYLEDSLGGRQRLNYADITFEV